MIKVRPMAFRVVVFAAVSAAGASIALAADATWPNLTVDPKTFRGPGFYLSLLKMSAAWLVFLAWVKTTDWISTDCQEMKKLNYQQWNPIVVGSFMAAFVLLWLLPSFWIGFPLLVIAYAVPLTVYIVRRNSEVSPSERVLTREHLRYWFAAHAGKLGMKVEKVKAAPEEAGSAVKLTADGGPDERTNQVRLLTAKQSKGLMAAREIVTECLANHATAMMLDYTQQAAAMRIMIDGVWAARDAKPREIADPALHALKALCGLDAGERRNRQEGQFAAEHDSIRYSGTLVAQGTSSGERVLLQFRDKKIRLKTLDELGMRTKVQEQLLEAIGAPHGLVLFSAIPDGGLRTTMDVALRSCDRFTREFATLEEASNRYVEVENIPVTVYDMADGASPEDELPKLLRSQPNVVVVRDMVNAQTAGILYQDAAGERMILSTVRAADCAEALMRMLALGAPPAEFAKVVAAVINQRLVRKLCDSCKEAYTPTPDILAQLGIPEGRVKAFYRPPQPPQPGAATSKDNPPKEPCKVCGATGYFGRTAIFELLLVGDAVRAVLAKTPKLNLLRQAARKDGMKSLQEEGALLVIKGTTSLPELIRVLKQ
jgi:type II secretory ATPase GspE/PulE/Tfp pilus assembly ATPase PilB-like protein